MAKTAGMYLNADDIKKASLCTDLKATVKAQELREKAISDHSDFTFETVLSTRENLDLLTEYDLTVNDKISLSCRELAQKIMQPNGIEIVF